MEDLKKYLIMAGVALVFVLLAPSIIALLGIVLSPIITTIGFVMLLLAVTAFIAYKNKIGRK